jgi:hypothetical protein
MNERRQPPDPRPSAAPETTTPPGAGPASDDEALMTMQRDFPGHRIWREILPGRTVYIARSHHPTTHPHTVVTPDLGELHAALTEARHAGGPR